MAPPYAAGDAYTKARMSLTIELEPEFERELAAQAARRGMDVPAYAASLLRRAAKGTGPQQRKGTLSEFFSRSPLAGAGIDLNRSKDAGRAIEL